MSDFNIAVEGLLDAAVARRLLEATGHSVIAEYNRGGKRNLDARLHAYNLAARHSAWFVLRDLDHDAPCPGNLRTALLPNPSPGIMLRIPVREVEAWLLADRPGIARFLSVSQNAISRNPETLADPKGALTAIAQRSRKRVIKDGLPPRAGSGRQVGPDYNALLTDFVVNEWSIDRAVDLGGAPSLGRSLERLREF